jgi:hypothetical protein
LRKRFLFSALIIIVVLTSIIAFVVYSNQNYYNVDNYDSGIVDIKVVPTKSYYLQGENINFTIYVNNKQDRPVRYPTSIYHVIEQNKSIIFDQIEYANYVIDQIPTFPAHNETILPLMWDQKIRVNDTIVQAEPGNYTFKILFIPTEDYGQRTGSKVEKL